MNKIINFLKKIGLLKVSSASYKGKNKTIIDPDFIPNKKGSVKSSKAEKNNSQGSW